MTKKIQVNARLDAPYALTLREFPNQNQRIQEGLDLIQDPRFKQELKKNKEAYGPTNIREDGDQEGHPDAQVIREEFAD